MATIKSKVIVNVIILLRPIIDIIGTEASSISNFDDLGITTLELLASTGFRNFVHNG